MFETKKMKIPITIFLFFVFVGVNAKSIYVNPKASSGNSGMSERQALKDIQTAALISEPGDTIWIMGGDYYGTEGSQAIASITKSGAAENWIVFKNYKEEVPVLHCTNMHGIVLQNVSFISLDGLEIKYEYKVDGEQADQSNYSGIWMESGSFQVKNSNIQIINIEISGFGGSAIYLQACSRFSVSRNKLMNNCRGIKGPSAAIWIKDFLDLEEKKFFKNEIDGNEIFNNVSTSMQDYSTGDCITKLPGSGILLENQDIVLQKLRSISTQTSISNNIIYKNSGLAISVQTTPNLVIANNTCYKNIVANASCAELSLFNIMKGAIINNIIYTNRGKGGSRSKLLEYVDYKNNLYFNCTDYDKGKGDTLIDPQFMRLDEVRNIYDFRLKDRSPAINKGERNHTTLFDFMQNNRTLGPLPDLGAIESDYKFLNTQIYAKPFIDQKRIKAIWSTNYSSDRDEFTIVNHRGRSFEALLYAFDGALLQRFSSFHEKGTVLVISGMDLLPGVYYVRAMNEGESIIGRFVKLKK